MTHADNKSTPIGKFGKFGLIDHIIKGILPQNNSTVSIIGDDSSVIDSGDRLTLVSTDLLLEGIHFNLVYTPLKHLGYKAVIRAISDIFAMNGSPGQVLVSLGISTRFAVEQVEELYEGILLACGKYKVDLAGGDTTSSLTGLTIGVTAVGTAGRGELVKRNGARPNDIICVTGNFGASYMGLQVLERERRLFDRDKQFKPDLSGYEYIIERQLKPEFPSGVLNELRDNNILPSSMIDVSDALASDLLHICKQSGTGCRIFYDKIPVDTETARTAEEFKMDAVLPALNGGEDYELLFTLPMENLEKVRNINGITLIGHITSPEKGHLLVSNDGNEIELKGQGWETADL